MFDKDQLIKNHTRCLYFFILAFTVFSLILVLIFKIGVFEQDEIEQYQLKVRPKISTLAINPNWDNLKYYQETISKKKFLQEIQSVYSEGESWKLAAKINNNYVDLKTKGNNSTRIFFSKKNSNLKAPRFWRKADELPKLIRSTNKPLSNISIAIDPGHIGGEWAKMEGRWYQINNSGIEIKEGELTLEVAKKLKQKLEKLGAKVELVRSEKRPVNQLSPIDFISLAKEILKSKGMDSNEKNIKRESEILFYRSHEIRRRAFIINKKIKPDIVICVHFNAESWGNPYSPILTKKNHLHLLINGNYSRSEFRLEDNRYHLFIRLFQGIHSEEFKISKAVAQSMAKETGLSPYKYKTSNAKLLDTNEPYIYARNLLANRIYHCPVIFLEPYVMNNKEFYDRVKLGSYSGFKTINGKKRKSLMDEYTDGVVNGLKKYYIESRN